MRRARLLKTTRLHRLLFALVCAGLVLAHYIYSPPPSSAASVVRTASGATPADIQAVVDQFRADLGGVNNGVGGGSFSGRREINWDAVPDNFAAPNNLPADFFNINSPRGVVFSTPFGLGFQVSANAINPTNTPARFGNLNANYPASFQTFSPERLFTPVGRNITDVTFFVPGTGIPATVSGFGAVFTDVDSPTSTLLTFFDKNGQTLMSQFVPPANNGLSFVGVSFNAGEQIASLRITSGNALVGANDDNGGAGSLSDVVVMDDFIYGEPQPLPNPNFFRWNGAGANANWSTGGNWVGGTAPTPGTTLEFPTGAAQLTNIDDFGTQTVAGSANLLLLTGSGYQLGSFNFLNLAHGIQATNPTGDNRIGIGIGLLGNQTFLSTYPGTKLTFGAVVSNVDNSDKTLTLDGAGDFAFEQTINFQSSGSVVKNGSGTVTLCSGGATAIGINTPLGKTTLNAGTLILNGINSSIDVTGGLLTTGNEIGSQAGFVVAGDINATGGTVAPGGLNGIGVLNTSALAFNSATTLDLQLNGKNPGGQSMSGNSPSEFDRLETSGAVNLGGSTLNLQLNFMPAETDSFTIINNKTVSNPTTGTFNGLPEGAIFTVNGFMFKITYHGGDGNDVVLTGVPRLSINDVNVTEGNSGTTNATFTVTLSSPSTQTITVDFGTLDGTATAGSDYGPRSGTRIFNPGQVSQTITIPINGDTIGEADETFFIVLSDPLGAVIARGTGMGTIVNDDAAPTPAQLSINNVTATEGDSGTTNAVFTVTLSPASNQAVSVDYFTSDGTANASSDYQFVSGTLIFNPGVTTRMITVPIKGDTVPEPTETFFVNLTNANNANISKAQGTGTINDNDGPSTPSQLSINNVTTTEGDSGTTNATFTVTLSPASSQAVSVDYFTSDGTADASSDYQFVSGTLTFDAGVTTRTITVPVKGDTVAEPTENFFVNLMNPVNATVATAQGTGTINDNDASGTFQFSAPTGGASESAGSVTVTITRTGDTAGAASVKFETSDLAATQRSDYTFGAGTVQFGPGETSKDVKILLVNDAFIEGDEALMVTLSNPSGNFVVGSPGSQVITITDDDSALATSNPIDEAQFFVRQQYLDFLGREPDGSGFQFWTNQITSCGSNPACISDRRTNVSAAFFLSFEFQETSGNVIRTQRVAFGHKSNDPMSRVPYLQFMRDTRQIGQGVIVGQPGFDTLLEQNKQVYAQQIVTSADFNARFPVLTAAQYVDSLFASAGVTPTAAERTTANNAFGGGGTVGRVAALRSVADSNSVRQAELNPSFVLAQFYGYLRRNPTDAPDFSDAGYQFWLTKLNQFNGNYIDAEMVKAFIASAEYRQRFGP